MTKKSIKADGFVDSADLAKEDNESYASSEKAADGIDNSAGKGSYEKCIICGKMTYVPSSMPVDWRENYEIGVGQLCVDCAKKQLEDVSKENMSYNAQVFRSVGHTRFDPQKK
jgi:hypothetical protein